MILLKLCMGGFGVLNAHSFRFRLPSEKHSERSVSVAKQCQHLVQARADAHARNEARRHMRQRRWHRHLSHRGAQRGEPHLVLGQTLGRESHEVSIRDVLEFLLYAPFLFRDGDDLSTAAKLLFDVTG